ncbi:MAG: hypothetical protein J7L12_01445 [Desulfurococcales archaeon]|nr:hypothetical protein [Desulfurococcales archaeon]MCD6428263.1 hypothetical protein [Desulfurococcales archaeon]
MYLNYIALMVLIAAVLTPTITHLVMRLEHARKFVSPDVHKPSRPLIPKSAGPSLIAVYAAICAIAYALGFKALIPYFIAVIISGLIGFIDDIYDIKAHYKILLFFIPAVPVVLSGTYISSPYLPGVGGLRLTLLYPILLLIGYSVAANAFNMADTHNGITPSILLIYMAFLAIASFITRPQPLSGFWLFYAISLAVFATYLPFNMYPAKIFNGNSGSHLMGVVFASLAVLSRHEFFTIIASAPLILNGFSILTTIRGLKNRQRVPRPVTLNARYEIEFPHSSKDHELPITLVQLFVLKNSLRESEVVAAYIMTYIISASLAVALTYLLETVTW